MKKRMKDRPGLLDDAERLADAGRKGDKIIAHITPEEAELLKARGGSGTINPRTGLLEFFSESDPMGSGADYGYGDNSTPDTRGAMENATNEMVGQMNAAATAPNYMEEAQAAQYAPRSLPQQFTDYVSHGFRDMVANPGRTALNAAIGMVPGVGFVNTALGLALGQDKTLGAGMLSGFNSMMADDKMNAPTVAALETDTPPGSPPDGPTLADSPGYNGQPSQQPAPLQPQAQPEQVAQEALRRAFMVNPGLLNQWTGNKFAAAGTAGKPNAYNQWQGNSLFRPPVFPGLIG